MCGCFPTPVCSVTHASVLSDFGDNIEDIRMLCGDVCVQMETLANAVLNEQMRTPEDTI